MDGAGDEDSAVYADEFEEEIIVNEDEEDLIVDGVDDVDLDDYDADQEDEENGDLDSACVTSFSAHKGPVFVVDIDTDNGLVVSGGEDDMAYVWEMESGNIVLTCNGHKDSVTCACFSPDGKYVATGDMSGIIQVWDMKTKHSIWNFETGDLEWLHWHPVASVLLAGTQDGQCWMWQIPKENCKIFESNGVATTCGKFMPSGKSAVVCFSDGTLKMLDLKSSEAEFSVKGRDGHSDGILDVSVSSDASLIVTASMDGTAKLISTSSGKVTKTYSCDNSKKDDKRNKDEEESDSIECVAFSSNLPLIAMGSLNGNLCLWDHKTGILRHTCKHEQGVMKLAWDMTHGGSVIYTACLDGTCRSWDARNGELVGVYKGPPCHIYDMKLSRNSERLVTAFADGIVKVFSVSDNNQLQQT